ncbi:hypothetical protein LTR91_021596 [Friedmanniomyces endolithicus]|uniref:C2H2-type domain-containing protein n=1 Tax=Friedmanniomyces endolithicus TaxID=329885 RepID=A0AAN6IZH2_9PEZI|nr:hypothetical protein LTS00_012353 [Friedmanniomyces endolithicus]KAK0289801.1 hypothetical protein LTR35_003000 [Friedmanniomyces endolithicus]KAK0303851.1 hypothetical protein LTR82_017418 [Friedmanniomyces endolithicus]KAK0896258.1 hypothetical protein LTR57_022640 [Friedmanniomyces endolithicus]KAK0957204.1 hypothetical protein LTS01_022475 [Friedmanniomyces endolithicus]
MPSKKRKVPDVQEILDRPWCYYCERDFDDMKILISHQRAKHFKCETCGRRLNTIGGLHVHLSQVHKETLTSVENALEHRTELGPEIFGMEGVPAEVLAAHKQRITEAFFKLEADRRTATGNPAPGGGGQGRVKTEDGVEVKKRKIESLDEIKKRLAKQRARKQAEKIGVKYESESEDEKEGEIKSEIKREVKSEVKSEIKSETDSEMQADWSPVKTEEAPAFYPAGFQPQFAPSPHSGFNPYQPPPQQGYPPFAYSPVNAQPFQNPGFAPSPYQSGAAFYPNDAPSHLHNPYPYGPAPPSNYGPVSTHKLQHYNPPVMPSSSSSMSGPGMIPSLPAPTPGLPQRPSFGLPNLSKEDMAKMHSGQGLPHGATAPPMRNGYPERRYPGPRDNWAQRDSSGNMVGDAVDDLISSVTGQARIEVHPGPKIKPEPLGDGEPTVKIEREATGEQTIISELPDGMQAGQSAAAIFDAAQEAPSPAINDLATATPPKTRKPAKKSKKSKKSTAEIEMRVYSDDVLSPEERKARKSRYSFDRNASEKTDFVMGDVSGAVTDEMGEDVVRDPDDSHF